MQGDLFLISNQTTMFETSMKEEKVQNIKIKGIEKEISELEAEIDEINNNKIYDNAFEWRFEFPEVLDDSGNFVGFALIIGNPPYSSKISQETQKYSSDYNLVKYKCDPYALFIERALAISNICKQICFITPLTYLTNYHYNVLRAYLIQNKLLDTIIVFDGLVFDEAKVDTSIIQLKNNENEETFLWGKVVPDQINLLTFKTRLYSEIELENRYEIFDFISDFWTQLKIKIWKESIPLKKLRKISLGMKLKGNENYISEKNDKMHPDRILFGKDINFFLSN